MTKEINHKKYSGITNTYTLISAEYPCEVCSLFNKCRDEELMCLEMKHHIYGSRELYKIPKSSVRNPTKEIFRKFG